SRVRELIVPENVCHIGYSAFNGCGSIVKATLPFIGSNAPSYEAYKTQSGSESLFGYIFGRDAYENATLIHQFMKYYDAAGVRTVKKSFLNEKGNVAYDTDGYGNYITEAGEVTSSPSVYGEAFWVPSGLAKVEFLDTFTKITNGQMSGVATLYDVKLPYHIEEIETAAFSGETNLRYINIPKPAIILHEAVFENMYEGSEERPNEIFFITASYNIDGGYPEGWVTGKDMPVAKKWHTKYIVYYEEDSDIFEYEYDYATNTFKIIGFTELLPQHVLTHRDRQYSRYILRIPELKCQRPVVEITDEALLGYNDVIDMYFELLQPEFDSLKSKDQLTINGIAIAYNVTKLGTDIIQGGENFVAYVCRTKAEATDAGYIAEEEWLGGSTGLVYYGEGVTWTLDRGNVIYQLLLSATKISFDLDSLEGLEYDSETGYFITYEGREFEPKPVISFDLDNENTVRVGDATLPEYDIVGSAHQGEYIAKYWNNMNVSYDKDGNVISDAWVYVFTNNTAIFTNRLVPELNVDESLWCDQIVNYPWYGDIVPSQDGSVPDGAKLSFKIIRRVLSIDIEDERTFEEGEIWENSDWSTTNSIVNVANFATDGEQFNGTLRLNGPDVNVDEAGNVIAYTNLM
ncbi:MAG: leucine-rich repeat domain-containing protein, partial [Anaeroplasmataceae bacterium]|nr:leucine-rich repeat domain-containing protein [Anaeroplasmataceae bacterium]